MAVLLTFAVVVESGCALGVLVMPTTLQKLHYVGPAVTVGPFLVALAMWVSAGVFRRPGSKPH